MNRCGAAFGGKYVHFKGGIYDAYCLAVDQWGHSFVLYQQCYGNRGFWLRPYEMFFDKIEIEGKTVHRFCPTHEARQTAREKVEELLRLLDRQTLLIKNSENEQPYRITKIHADLEYVCVHPISEGLFSDI